MARKIGRDARNGRFIPVKWAGGDCHPCRLTAFYETLAVTVASWAAAACSASAGALHPRGAHRLSSRSWENHNMPPQPLTSARPGYQSVRFHLIDDAMEKRPKLAGLVMRIINIWSYTDHSLATLTTSFLKADFETVTEMLQALTGIEGRRAAITAAAQSTLSVDDFNLFTAVMRVIRPLRKRRNDFAHFLWGILPDEPDVLLLLNPKYLAQYDAKTRSWSKEFMAYRPTGAERPEIPPRPEIDFTKVFVYREQDLIEDVNHATKASQFVFMLQFALSPSHPAAEHVRTELCNQPQVQQALERLSPENSQ